MLTLRKILHPTDFSESADAALVQAFYLARHHDAEVHLLHVTPTFGTDPLRGAFDVAVDEEGFYKDLWRQMDARLQEVLAALPVGEVRMKRVHSRGAAPAPVILDYARNEEMDLVVMGTHGRRGVRRLLVGSVAEEVMRRAPCPVLAVHADDTQAPLPAVRRILAPVDFSDASREALAHAKALAVLYGARLSLLHVVARAQYPDFYQASLLQQQQVEDEIVAEAEAMLQQWHEALPGAPVATTYLVRTGYPPKEILEAVEETAADLLVMATHGLTGLQHFMFGSVTEKVMRRAPCPLFIVKSFGKSLLSPSTQAEGAVAAEA